MKALSLKGIDLAKLMLNNEIKVWKGMYGMIPFT